jgi:hypothetical protein
MRITVEGMESIPFKFISQGDFFIPYPNSLYLKIEESIDEKGSKTNAVDMEGGHLAYFKETQEVQPVDSEVNVICRISDYTIEN